MSLGSLFSKVLDKMLKHMDVRSWCETCGTVFLETSYDTFLQFHSWNKQKPDKWFVKAMIHCCENPDHVVMSNLPDDKVWLSTGEYEAWNISQRVKESIVNHGTTNEKMLRTLQEIYEQVKNKAL